MFLRYLVQINVIKCQMQMNFLKSKQNIPQIALLQRKQNVSTFHSQ